MYGDKFQKWLEKVEYFYVSLGLCDLPLYIDRKERDRIIDLLNSGGTVQNIDYEWVACQWLSNPDVFLEQCLLSMQKKYCLYIYSDGVFRDDAFYKDLLQDMSRQSEDVVEISRVTEEWVYEDEEDYKPYIMVKFNHENERRHIWMYRETKHAPTAFIDAVNYIIGDTEKSFEVSGYPNEWMILFVNAYQKKKLQNRGWEFWAPDAGQTIFAEDFLLWQAEQNIRFHYFDELFFWLEDENAEKTVKKNVWLLYYRGLAYRIIGDVNSAWRNWSLAMNFQDEKVMALIDKYSVSS